MQGRIRAVLSIVIALGSPVTARAQNADIFGLVTDAAGLPLPRVTIVISGPSLLLPRSATTSPAGSYRLPGIPAGTYTMSFERDGFERQERLDVRIGGPLGAEINVGLDAERRGGAQTPEPSSLGARAGGSNRVSASASYTITNRRLQSNNLTPVLKAQGAGFGSPVRRITGVEVEAAGPISRDRAWFRGAVDRTETDVGVIGFYAAACLNPDGSVVAGAASRAECLRGDVTRVEHVTARLQYRWNSAHRSTVVWGRSETLRPMRGASAHNRPEHTNRQSDLGRAQPLQLQHEWAVSDRLAVEGRYSFSDASFILDFQDEGLARAQGAYDRYTLVHWRSGVQTEHRRPTRNVLLTATETLPALPSGHHAATFGLEYLDSRRRSIERTGGGAVAVFDSRDGPQTPYQARVVRDGDVHHRAQQWSAFVQDSYRRGPLTINAGIRFDRQDDRALAAAIPANAVLPDLLPAVRFAGADSGVVYNDLSPRLGATWEIGGRGKTVVKASVARHHAIGNDTSAPLQPTGPTRLVFWWNDADGDRLVRREELDLARGFAATPTSNYDAASPEAVRTPASVDARMRSTVSDQLTVGFEHQLARRLSVRASYVARAIHRLQAAYPVNDDGSPVGSGTFSPVQWTPRSCPDNARCPTVTYFERALALPARTLLRNDGRHGRHHAVDVVLHKRQADGWMLDVALTWNRARWFFPEPTRDYTDPTNIAMRNGTGYSMAEPRWLGKISGMLRLPWAFTTEAFLSVRDGFPYARVVTSPNRDALGSTGVLISRYGSERYPGLGTLDWRVERALKAGRLSLVPALDICNALNSNAVLRRNPTQNSQSANAVTQILPPRVIRLEVRAGW